jgi:hypothetical protein
VIGSKWYFEPGSSSRLFLGLALLTGGCGGAEPKAGEADKERVSAKRLRPLRGLPLRLQKLLRQLLRR